MGVHTHPLRLAVPPLREALPLAVGIGCWGRWCGGLMGFSSPKCQGNSATGCCSWGGFTRLAAGPAQQAGK